MTIARLSVRPRNVCGLLTPDQIDPEKPGLILGFDTGVFKPGHVYQFQQVLGEITVLDLGPSASILDDDRTWAHNISDIVEMGRSSHLLTPEEQSQWDLSQRQVSIPPSP